MKYLKNKLCYLSHPIEYSDKNFLETEKQILLNKYELNIFDPADDPKQQWKPILDEARKNKDYELMSKIARKFVRKDLTYVDKADLLIGYIPKDVKTTGTVHEVIVKNEQKKPVLLICPNGREFLSLWYFGFIDLEFIFGSWQELYKYLDEVDAGYHKDNERWAFVYNLI